MCKVARVDGLLDRDCDMDEVDTVQKVSRQVGSRQKVCGNSVRWASPSASMTGRYRTLEV